MSASGTLYVVATPIGNLADITLRALEVLREVGAVLAEDTRRTGLLLKHYGIRTPLVPFHEHTAAAERQALVERLRRGQSLALVTDAGTPGIADPGERLVAEVARVGVPVVPIPGPSALTAALAVCGFPTDRVSFFGFLPHKKGRQTLLRTIAQTEATTVLFESPYRIVKLLKEFSALDAERAAVVLRELTKVFEEARRGTVGELEAFFAAREDKQRGEFVVVLGPKKNS